MHKIELSKQLTIPNSILFIDKIKSIFDEPKEITIDGGIVEKVDAASLQILLALTIELERRSIQWTWSSLSNTLRKNINTIGLTHELQAETSGEKK